MNRLSEEIFESDYESEGEFSDMEAGDYESDYEADYEGEWGYQGEGPFNEEQELELAAELLGVSEEAELDQFLGKLFKRLAPAVGGIIGSPSGQALKGLLKNTAKKGLPMLGRAVGGYFGGAKGGDIGADVGSLAGRVFGLELEGMSPEDQELQVAKQFVRLAGDAIAKAGQAPSGAAPQQVARTALASAARQHAPGLLRNGGGAAPGAGFGGAAGARVPRGRKRTGRWIRRGNKIVLFGV
jgi:hypothetical protein